ncbi:MAG: DUF4412 domain-containing protein [Bacteroidales bacterium]|nr:DUF4412 domain-containing protein [Bacteroidales bacterium]
MKLILFNVFFFGLWFNSGFTLNSLSQDFEGKIVIVQMNVVDTVHFEFTLKNKFIRINQFNNSGITEKVYMVNLNDSLVYEINDKRKIYIKYSLRKNSPYIADQDFIEIKKTENFKFINGYKCYQWIVINKIKNTSVSYWVAKENFGYLIGVLQNINRSDKKCSYFMFIPEYSEFFPFQSVERSILREFRTKDQIVSIKEEKVPDDIFVIPKDYNEIHR